MTIALHGSYFRYNFGDTLLCRLFCHWIHKVTDGESVVLPIADEINKNLIGAEKRGVMSTYNARALLFCGGGYFSEPSGDLNRWSIRAYLRHIWLAEAAMKLNRPYAIIGVGAGPLTTPWLRKRVLRVFENAVSVVVRDQESYDFLIELGVTRPIVVATDAVLSLTDDAYTEDSHITALADQIHASGKRLLVVHTNCHPTARELAVVDTAAEWAASQPDVHVIFADDSVSRRKVTWPTTLKAKFPGLASRSDIFAYDGHPDRLITLLKKSDGIVTTKLHVGIVGSVLERPVVSVPKHSKTPRFYRQIGLSDQCVTTGEDWRAPLVARLNYWATAGQPDFTQMRKVIASFSYPAEIKSFLNGASR
ncbi:polysaccharide pyruvyl transferase family protein [Brevundimonas sp.]|uniref:polysaccharide pyruvyl transferase family protein n=1 Tax=Brevundimonas sp. TaxID=1871086 RepID=UPI0017F95DDB|nr:polysaccharide pyruvyl transferase family protein [Brevundimonas sp.]MBA4809159.1 polysaccharide pyruvyl transferase family protein [Brevundimonas sp.]